LERSFCVESWLSEMGQFFPSFYSFVRIVEVLMRVKLDTIHTVTDCIV